MTKKNYEKIASEKIRKPSTVPVHRKFLIYARNKVGKTSFCLSAMPEGLLIADPEHGTDPYTKQDPDVWPIDKWDDLDEFYKFLRLGKHEYQWAALDGMTKMHNMALAKVMKLQEEKDIDRIPGLVKRQDYGKAGELSKRLIDNFLNLEMGVIFTAQERKVTTESEEDEELDIPQTEYVPDLPKGARGAINSAVDVIGRMYTQKVKVRVKGTKKTEVKLQRRLWVAPHDSYDTGYRSDYELPEFVRNPSVPKLVSLTMSGKES